MVLIQTFIDVGDLALAEGIAQGIVDVLDRDAETRSGIAVNDDGALQTVELLIGINVPEFGNLAQALLKNRSPMDKISEIVALERVLILSAAKTAADAEILDGLQVEGGSWNFGRLRTNACDDLIHAELAFAERLELAEHASGAAAAAATTALAH